MSKWSPLVKQYRKERGLTPIQLAHKLNVAPNTVSRWETGVYDVSSDFTWTLAETYFGGADSTDLTRAIRYLSGLQAQTDASKKGL